jgi:regulator of protease activity HflC (stomatin/prohibitin superfamily)
MRCPQVEGAAASCLHTMEARRSAGRPGPFCFGAVMFKKIFVKKDERALLFRRGDFVQMLPSGEHAFFDPLGRLSVQTFSVAKPHFDHPLAEYIVRTDRALAEREFHIVELKATEIGLRYESGVLCEMLAPNTRRLYWKSHIDMRFDVIDIVQQFELAPHLVPELVGNVLRNVKLPGADALHTVWVPQHHAAILYVDGGTYRLLPPGMHGFWRYNRHIESERVDLRLQVMEVAGQEILTKDKVTLRVNLTASYRVSDVLLAYTKQAKPVDYLYKELQFGLRAAVGTRSLDELLENKSIIDEVVSEHIKRRIDGYGLEVDSVGVKDIILPGEMKTLLAKVVEADKAAQANVIRRREETAATRSLLNTAKVMEDNPIALRLKELETLEKVTEKIDKISVFGGLDGVLKDLVKIRP